MRPQKTVIVPYSPDLAHHFREINAEWIEGMFELEQADEKVLNDPQGEIIDKGGRILFASAEALGIVGTCALKPMGDGAFELTKMGVRSSARGLKIGEFLLGKVLDTAHQMQMSRLFLLTNRKCEAAIHLYEKAGFVHDPEIMSRYGAGYRRCDVAMNYPAIGAVRD